MPAALIALLVLVLVEGLLFACDSAESSSEGQEAIFETYHSAVAGLNDLNQQAIAEVEASDARQSLTDSQLASEDLRGLAVGAREAQSSSLRSANLYQQQIELVDNALESCLNDELVELLVLHRQKSVRWRDTFEAEAEVNGMAAETFELLSDGQDIGDPRFLGYQELFDEWERLSGEAEFEETFWSFRQNEVLARPVTPVRCE